MEAKTKTIQTSYRVPALEKGLDILEALAASPVPLSLAELARNLNRGTAEIFRMLVCLEQRNYIHRGEVSGKYAPTLRLFELAHAHSPIQTLLDVSREPMRELAVELGESCHLSILERESQLIILSIDSPETIRLSVARGARLDPKLTASGKILLDPSKESITAQDQIVTGVDDFVVRIGSPDSVVNAALAVPVLRGRVGVKSETQILAALKKTAKAIHQSLGI